MRRTLPPALLAGLLTAALAVPVVVAHDEPLAPQDERTLLYFNQQDGRLTLSELPPSARHPTHVAHSGYFFLRSGLDLRLRLENPNPDLVVNESHGVNGWAGLSFSWKYTGPVSLYSPQVRTEVLLVEGARTVPMTPTGYKSGAFRGDFPGHAGAGTPHTHGDGTDAARPLLSGDFHYDVRVSLPSCTGGTCDLAPYPYSYTFTVAIDGTSGLEFVTTRPLPEPEPEAPIEAPEDDGNGTDPAEPPANASNDPGPTRPTNSSSSGSGSAQSGFEPRSYDARQADGAASGVPLAFLVASVAGWAWRRSRLGRA